MLGQLRRSEILRKIALASIAAYAAAGNMPLVAGDCYQCGPSCPVNSRFYGYYPTKWRRWPGTEPTEAQQAPTPAELQNVPLVEPPKPNDEVPPPKTPGGETTPGATTPDTTPGDLPPPGGAKTKANGGPAATPATPDSLRYVPRTNSPESLTLSPPAAASNFAAANSAAPKTATAGAAPLLSPDWPPVNTLRGADLRGNFQMADGLTFPGLRPNQTPPAATPPTAKPNATVSAPPSALEKPAAYTSSSVATAKLDRQSPSDTNPLPVGASPAVAASNPTPPATMAPELTTAAPPAMTRMPLMPSKVWNNPPPPLDAAAVKDAQAPGAAGPEEASIFAMAPPTRVTDIGVPATPGAVQAQQVAGPNMLPPAVTVPPTGTKSKATGAAVSDASKAKIPAAQTQELSQIDPLAIGRSLSGEEMTPPALPLLPRPAAGRTIGAAAVQPTQSLPRAKIGGEISGAPSFSRLPPITPDANDNFSTARSTAPVLTAKSRPVDPLPAASTAPRMTPNAVASMPNRLPANTVEATGTPTEILAPASPVTAIDPLHVEDSGAAPLAGIAAPPARIAASATTFGSSVAQVPTSDRVVAASSTSRDVQPPRLFSDNREPARVARLPAPPTDPQPTPTWTTNVPSGSVAAKPTEPKPIATWQPPAAATLPQAFAPSKPAAPQITQAPPRSFLPAGTATASDVIASDDAPPSRVQTASYATQDSSAPVLSRSNPLRGVEGANQKRPEFSAADWSDMPTSFTQSGWTNPLRQAK